MLLLYHQLICVFVVLHYLIVFHVIIWDCLSTEHYQGVLVHHVKSYQPNTTIYKCMQHNPGITFYVKLLDWGLVASCLVAYCVDISMSKRATIRPSDCLLQTWKCFLVHRADLKILALFQILTLQRPSYNVHNIFKLSYSEVNSIVHHFSESLKVFRWDIEKQDLGTWDICRPIELICFVSTHN